MEKKYYISYERMNSGYYGEKTGNEDLMIRLDKINQENSSFAKERIRKELHKDITKAIPTGKININYFDYYSGNITPVVKNECKLLSEQGFNVTQCSVSYLHSDFIATIKAFKNKS